MTCLQELILKSPDPMTALLRLGKAVAESRMFGAGTEMQGVIIIAHCLDKGIPLLDWAAEHHMMDIKGKVSATAKSEILLARFNASGGKHKWLSKSDDVNEALLELTKNGESITVKFTMEDAKRAQLLKADSNWAKWPAPMLRSKAVTSGLTMFDPSVKVGVTATEDAEDMGGVSLSDESYSPPTSASPQQASQDGAASDKPKRGRPTLKDKNKETGAADGSADAVVKTGTTAASECPAITAAPTAVESTPTTSSAVESSPQPEPAKTAVDESRFTQVQWLEREKLKFYAMTPEKLKELGVPDDIASKITMDDRRWGKIAEQTGTAIIAEMGQEALDALENAFKGREERLKPYVEKNDVESYLNDVLTGKR